MFTHVTNFFHLRHGSVLNYILAADFLSTIYGGDTSSPRGENHRRFPRPGKSLFPPDELKVQYHSTHRISVSLLDLVGVKNDSHNHLKARLEPNSSNRPAVPIFDKVEVIGYILPIGDMIDFLKDIKK